MFDSFHLLLPIFFSILLTCALLVILIPNPIHSVLFLVLLFCNVAALLLLFKIEFLSILLIIIYVGAITILFLFVVMMLDITVILRNANDFYNYLFFSSFIVLSFFFITFLSPVGVVNKNVMGHPHLSYTEWVLVMDTITNTGTLGQILYTFYMAYFLMAGIILLIALIGAVTLTHKIHDQKKLDTSTFKQISRLKNHSIFNIH